MAEREQLAEFLWQIEAPRTWIRRRNIPPWMFQVLEPCGVTEGGFQAWTPQFPAMFNGRNSFEDIIVSD